MSLLESIRAAFEPVDSDTKRLVGAYWCHDCSVRVPVYDGQSADEDRPTCPECDGSMQFERSPDSGSCAC